MKRLPDWEKRLQAVFDEWQNKPFILSETDCCCFVACCVDAQHGTNISDQINVNYKDEKAAREYLLSNTWNFNNQEYKVSSLTDLGNKWLGEPIPVLMAQRGDLVLFKTDEIETFSIVGFSGREIITMHKSGLKKLPLRMGIIAWRV